MKPVAMLNKQTEIRTDRRGDGGTDKQTDRQTTDGQTDRYNDKLTGQTENGPSVNRQTNGKSFMWKKQKEQKIEEEMERQNDFQTSTTEH